MNISLIGVPMFFGSDKKGVEFGPKKLREKGIIDILKHNYHTVYDCGDLAVENIDEKEKFSFHCKLKYLEPIVKVNRTLAHTVYSTLSYNSFPLVIGGDHSLGLGSISGVSKYYNHIAVIWVDAHGDINTTETSITGNVHGMPLSAAMGIGSSELTDLYYSGTKVNTDNAFIIGARDLDDGEKALIKNKNLNVYSTQDIKKIGIEKILKEVMSKIQNNKIENVHLSFDIDCLDSKIVPGTGTPVKNGMKLSEVKFLLKYLMETKLIKSMDFVELNPLLDVNDATSNMCIELLDWTFKYLK